MPRRQRPMAPRSRSPGRGISSRLRAATARAQSTEVARGPSRAAGAAPTRSPGSSIGSSPTTRQTSVSSTTSTRGRGRTVRPSSRSRSRTECAACSPSAATALGRRPGSSKASRRRRATRRTTPSSRRPRASMRTGQSSTCDKGIAGEPQPAAPLDFLHGKLSRRQFLTRAGVGSLALLTPAWARAARLPPAATVRDDSIVVRWNEAVLQGVRESKLGPPMVSRALAIIHTAMYDSWAAYDRDAAGTRFGGALRRPPAERIRANKEEAISFAAYRAAVDLFPASRTTTFDPFMATLGFDLRDSTTYASAPAGVGNLVAHALLKFRHADGANQLGNYADYTGFASPNAPMDLTGSFDPATVRDPNAWQPLQYRDATGTVVSPGFVGAQWQRVTPFALTSTDMLRSSTGPARYGSTQYVTQAEELLALSAAHRRAEDDRGALGRRPALGTAAR